MKLPAVFLDAATLGPNFPLDTLQALPLSWTFHPKTSPIDTASRIAAATVVVTNKVRLPKEILERAPNLKVICVAATGYDVVDVAAAKELGIVVCNVPGYSTPSVVQLTMLLILALFNSLISYAADTRAGRWQKSSLFCFLDYPLTEVQGKKIGIAGYGAIGKQVGHLCKAFGMEVLVAQHLNPQRAIPSALSLSELLPQIDIFTLHLPLTPQTRNIISAKELALLKPSAYLVNVSRGGLVNEADLAEALRQKRLAGAAFDVLTSEPPSPDNPLLQKDVPNLILTPHIAWASIEARHRLIHEVAGNITAFLHGAPRNRCD